MLEISVNFGSLWMATWIDLLGTLIVGHCSTKGFVRAAGEILDSIGALRSDLVVTSIVSAICINQALQG